jgi:hypothetical protein
VQVLPKIEGSMNWRKIGLWVMGCASLQIVACDDSAVAKDYREFYKISFYTAPPINQLFSGEELIIGHEHFEKLLHAQEQFKNLHNPEFLKRRQGQQRRLRALHMALSLCVSTQVQDVYQGLLLMVACYHLDQLVQRVVPVPDSQQEMRRILSECCAHLNTRQIEVLKNIPHLSDQVSFDRKFLERIDQFHHSTLE